MSLLFAVASSYAAELAIYVYPDGAKPTLSVSPCTPLETKSCVSNLNDAMRLLQNSQWQNLLGTQFSKVSLRLAAGTYRQTQAVALTWGYGVTQDIALEIAGAGTQTVISGALPVSAWHLATDQELPRRVVAKARGKLWVADVSNINLPLNVLPAARGYGLPKRPVMTEFFTSSGVHAVAAWPNVGYGRLARPGNLAVDEKKTFAVEGRVVSDWSDEPDLQVFAYWFWDWAAQTYLVSQKDAANNLMTLFAEGSPYGIKAGQRMRVEGALAELDMPGEWYLDRFDAKLYYWPDAAFPESVQELSVAPEILRISDSRKITIHDLSFEKTRGDAIVVGNSSDVVFDNVTIRFTGNRALLIENSNNCGVRNSLMEDNGEGGVLLDGGDRQTLRAANNFVENSVIRRFSRLMKTSRFAVELNGVGQRVVNNKISNAPHTAIFFSGNDHLISKNEIFNVVTETSDAGAIYIGRDYTARGTLIEKNYLHDIRSPVPGREVKGIYLDDQASGIAIRGNLFVRVQQPVFIGGGRDNIVDSNLFFNSSPALHVDARGLTGGPLGETLNPNGTLQKGLDAVPYRAPIYAARYPNLQTIREDEIGAPKYNRMSNNLVIFGEIASLAADAKSRILLEKNAILTDAVFLNSLAPDTRLKPSDFRLKENVWGFTPGYGMPPFSDTQP